MNTRKRVEAILEYMPATRSDDKLLCVIFLQKAGLGLTDAQIKAFYKMDDLWTVRRCRQKIQEEGKYPPTPEVEADRYKKFKHVRATIVESAQPEYEDHRGEYSPAKEELRARFNLSKEKI
jgi:hypothetical protein